MAMFTVSQSSLLLPQPHSISKSSLSTRRWAVSSSFVDCKGPPPTTTAFVYPFNVSPCCCFFKNNRLDIHRTISAQLQNLRSNGILVRVFTESEAVPLIVESPREYIDPQPDASGGDGHGGSHRDDDDFGGSRGGGGGGGGGDGNNEDNDDDSINSSSKTRAAMSMSQKLTLGYAALVGVGGVMGYVRSGSHKSLAAGGLSVLLLYIVYTELPLRPAFASSLGLGLSAALLGVMGSRFKKSGKIFPAGVVSFVSLVMTGGYLHGILRSLHG